MRYRTLNNSVKKACNAAKRNYINNLAEELATNNNPKPFWNFVKSMRKGSNNLVSFNVDGVTLSNDLSIRPVARIFYGWVRSVDYTDQRAPEALFTRGVRGHAPPGNFEN